MPQFTDVVFDIETTGTGPELNAIIQIAAVQFNLETREVNPSFFNRCLFIPSRRHWDEATREWWCKMPVQLSSIYDRMEDPATVMANFREWLGGNYCNLAGWNKPLSFDTPFVTSYFKEFCPAGNPLPYWKGRDLRSFIAGMGTDFNEKSVPFQGTLHDALDDTLHELRILYAALDHKCKSLTLEADASAYLETPI